MDTVRFNRQCRELGLDSEEPPAPTVDPRVARSFVRQSIERNAGAIRDLEIR